MRLAKKAGLFPSRPSCVRNPWSPGSGEADLDLLSLDLGLVELGDDVVDMLVRDIGEEVALTDVDLADDLAGQPGLAGHAVDDVDGEDALLGADVEVKAGVAFGRLAADPRRGRSLVIRRTMAFE